MNRLMFHTRRYKAAGFYFVGDLSRRHRHRMEGPHLDRYFQYFNEAIEEELMGTPSVNRCTVMSMARLWVKEAFQTFHWGERLEATPFPENPYSPSDEELEVFARALNQANLRADGDLDQLS